MKPQQLKSSYTWSATARVAVHASVTLMLFLVSLLVPGLHIGSGIAHAQVPTVNDIAACNREASLRLGTASPTAKDHLGAAAARRAAAATATSPGAAQPEASTAVTQSPDPHIDGMDIKSAKDPAYRAAYRVCMRQNGF